MIYSFPFLMNTKITIATIAKPIPEYMKISPFFPDHSIAPPNMARTNPPANNIVRNVVAIIINFAPISKSISIHQNLLSLICLKTYRAFYPVTFEIPFSIHQQDRCPLAHSFKEIKYPFVASCMNYHLKDSNRGESHE